MALKSLSLGVPQFDLITTVKIYVVIRMFCFNLGAFFPVSGAFWVDDLLGIMEKDSCVVFAIFFTEEITKFNTFLCFEK